MEKCSRLISLDDEGTRCRAWAATQDNKTIDILKKNIVFIILIVQIVDVLTEVVILYMTKQRKISISRWLLV